MRRRIALFFIVLMLCSLMPQAKVYSLTDKEKIDLKTLTPEKVRQIANEDMKELYGEDNYYPSSTKYGLYNTSLVQQQIDEAIKKPDMFKGFSMVYGNKHGTEITYKGKKMFRYSGYNVFGDPVSTDGFPWDAGWSGRQLQNLPMLSEPSGQHMYKITESTNVTIQVNPLNQMLYTHANMPNGKYNIRVWFDDTKLTKGNHAYKVLSTLKGVKELDSVEITVVGSMFDDLNN